MSNVYQRRSFKRHPSRWVSQSSGERGNWTVRITSPGGVTTEDETTERHWFLLFNEMLTKAFDAARRRRTGGIEANHRGRVMTEKSSMTGEEILDHPFVWSEFQKKLSLGYDSEHDRKIILSFSEMLGLPIHRVVNKMRTFCHPSNGTIN